MAGGDRTCAGGRTVMIIWTIKQLVALRRAITGRRNPSQLAWAVGLGLLLGVVPHGNLLAACLLILVLSLKINHAMAGLTAVATTFAASFLDPYSHLLGEAVLTHPQVAPIAARAWQLPLVPWTDLNNTVVMGSFLIGSAAVVPTYLLTYPIFRLLAPSLDPDPTDAQPSAAAADPVDAKQHEILLVDQRHTGVGHPHQPGVAARIRAQAEVTPDFVETDESGTPLADSEPIAVDTRIDVIRMKDYRDTKPASPPPVGEAQPEEQQPMDEALNYLLRQLRDSKQRKVA